MPSRIIQAGFSAGMTCPPLTDLMLCQQCHLNSIPSHPHRFPCTFLSLQALTWLCKKISLPSFFSAVSMSDIPAFASQISRLDLSPSLHLTQMQYTYPFCRYICSCSVHCKNGIYLLWTFPYFYILLYLVQCIVTCAVWS